jgi:hypothetical protein
MDRRYSLMIETVGEAKRELRQRREMVDGAEV